MTELMVHVERAVRPVRAGGSRKLKMREELLAHLTAIYAEERARAETDADAVREAGRRFGDPAALTKELQDTVPRVERFLCRPLTGSGWEWRTVRWVYPRAGEGAVRHAARVAAVFAAFTLALLGLTVAVAHTTGESWSPFRIGAATAAVMTAHAFVSAMLCVGFFRATSGLLTPRALLVAVACGVLLLASGPALAATLAAVRLDNPLAWWVLLFSGHLERTALAGLIWLLALAVVFRWVTGRQRRMLEWMELKLDG